MNKYVGVIIFGVVFLELVILAGLHDLFGVGA